MTTVKTAHLGVAIVTWHGCLVQNPSCANRHLKLLIIITFTQLALFSYGRKHQQPPEGPGQSSKRWSVEEGDLEKGDPKCQKAVWSNSSSPIPLERLHPNCHHREGYDLEEMEDQLEGRVSGGGAPAQRGSDAAWGFPIRFHPAGVYAVSLLFANTLGAAIFNIHVGVATCSLQHFPNVWGIGPNMHVVFFSMQHWTGGDGPRIILSY